MKTVKSLLLGSAAGFVALTGAQAADLPMAEPVEYVKICSTYGEGFFYIPGTDTCLQISGKVRVDLNINKDDFDDDTAGTLIELGDESLDDFSTRARGVAAFDARTETEWGTLRSYIEYEFNSDTAEFIGSGSNDEGIEQIAAFVQFAGITAGKAPSFYDFVEYDSVGDFFSAEDVWTLAYTASFGSGFAATIAVEDKSYRALTAGFTEDAVGIDADGPDDILGTADDDAIAIIPGEGADLDQVWPNVIAALRVDQAWGSAQVSGAVQDNEGDRDEFLVGGFDGDEIGWAVQAGVKVNVPFFNEGSYVWAQAAYSEGAVSYAGAEDFTGNFINVGLGIVDQDFDGVDTFDNNELLQVGGGVGAQLSETVRLNLMATYFEYDSSLGDLEGVTAEGNVFWTPVDNLDLGVAVVYGTAEGDLAGVDDGDVDTWGVIGRIERGF